MANEGAGVVGLAALGLTTGNGKGPGPDTAFWTWLVFGSAVAFLVFVYFGFGGSSGSILS